VFRSPRFSFVAIAAVAVASLLAACTSTGGTPGAPGAGSPGSPASSSGTADANASPGASDRQRAGTIPPTTNALVESPDPRFIVDRNGRVLILRGTNVISAAKSDPQHTGGVDEADIAALSEVYGFNVSRHLIFWDAIEPQKSQYDTAYLDRLGERLDWYAAHNVYVILDMHQDLYAQKFGGDGAPDWAVIDDGIAFEPNKDAPWWVAAVAPAVQRAYRNFWDADRGHAAELQQHYLDAWKHVVGRFKDHAAVIGYDIMNEPGFANGDLQATLAFRDRAMQDGDWSNKTLVDFTQKIIDGIRALDDDAYIFYEPTSLLNVNLGPPLGGPFPGDVTTVTDPRNGPPRLVYAPHLYDTKLDFDAGYAVDDPYVTDWEKVRTEDRAKQGGALFVGEFGSSHDQPRMEAYVNDVLAMADRQMIGFTHWSYDAGSWGFEADGKPTPWATWLVRPYPRAIAGTPTSFSFDPTTRVFRLAFVSRPEATGPTEISLVPSKVYPDGYTVAVSGDPSKWSQWYDDTTHVLAIATDPAAATYTVCVAPTGTPTLPCTGSSGD